MVLRRNPDNECVLNRMNRHRLYVRSKKILNPILLSILGVVSIYSLLYFWVVPLILKPEPPAFPGAEGFGSNTPGGRFGKVLIVTNLNDTTDINHPDYVGSLRWALEHSWENDNGNPYGDRRFIVFNVSGTINLVDKLYVRFPFVTIAGQSSPGGILLKGEELAIATHDVIVRGIRIRVGDKGTPTCCRDGVSISTYYASSDVYNVVIDHSSISWAVDENLSIWNDPTSEYDLHDITVQWNIISHGLDDSIHVDEGAEDGVFDSHSMGLIVGDLGRNITLHHNLFALNEGRNPRVNGIDGMEIFNNVIYGWGFAGLEFGSSNIKAHVFGNYFKALDHSSSEEIYIPGDISSGSSIFLSDNFVDDIRFDPEFSNVRVLLPENFLIAREEIFDGSRYKRVSSQNAYDVVIEYAGSMVPVRDAIDKQVIEDVENRTGKIIDSQSELGGWPDVDHVDRPVTDADKDGIPDEWEIAHGLDPENPADSNSTDFLSPGGYTWLEEYVNSFYSEYSLSR